MAITSPFFCRSASSLSWSQPAVVLFFFAAFFIAWGALHRGNRLHPGTVVASTSMGSSLVTGSSHR